jgi:hypothetical protein
MPVIFYVLLGMIVFSVIALLLTPNLFRPSPEAQRIMDISKSDRPDQRTIHAKELMQNNLLGAASALRVRLGLADNPQLKARLSGAGIHGNASADIFFASQFLAPLAGGVAGSLIGSNTLTWILGLGVAGYLAPDIWLNRKTPYSAEYSRRT